MRVWRGVIRPGLVVTGVVLAVLVGGAADAGRDLALPGAIAVAVLVATVVQAGRAVPLPRRAGFPPPPPSDALRPFRRLTALRERIEWGTQSPEHFRSAMVTVLDELATDRLRRNHRVDRHADPAAARRLLGPDLEALLSGRTDRVPDLTTIDDYVRRIEAL